MGLDFYTLVRQRLAERGFDAERAKAATERNNAAHAEERKAIASSPKSPYSPRTGKATTGAERMRRYRERHPDRDKASRARYLETHKDHNARYAKAWREQHQEKVQAYQQAYRLARQPAEAGQHPGDTEKA